MIASNEKQNKQEETKMTNLNAVITKLQKFEAQKEDVLTKNIRVAYDGTFTIDGRYGYTADDTTLAQVCKFFIPKGGSGYLQHCEPDMVAFNLNRWIGKKVEGREKPFFIRTRVDEGGNRILRTIMSDQNADLHQTVGNLAFLERILPALEAQDLKAESFHITDHQMHLRLTNKTEVDVSVNKVGDIVKAGLHISNSETGLGSYKLLSLLYRLACLNGMIVGDALEKFNRAHRGNLDELYAFINNAIGKVHETAFSVIDAVKASHNDMFYPEKVEAVLKYITDKYGWTKKFNELIYTNFQNEEQSKFGVIQAVTHSAKQFSGNDRLRIERQATDILTLDLNKLSFALN